MSTTDDGRDGDYFLDPDTVRMTPKPGQAQQPWPAVRYPSDEEAPPVPAADTGGKWAVPGLHEIHCRDDRCNGGATCDCPCHAGLPLATGLTADEAVDQLTRRGADGEDTANRAVAEAMAGAWSGLPRDHYVHMNGDGTFSVGVKIVIPPAAAEPVPGPPSRAPWAPPGWQPENYGDYASRVRQRDSERTARPFPQDGPFARWAAEGVPPEAAWPDLDRHDASGYAAEIMQAIELVDWHLDDAAPQAYKDSPLANRWRRVTKVCEEAGEVWRALSGATGENPRKGTYGDEGAVMDELADTAVAALLAIQCLTKDRDRTWAKFMASLSVALSRVPVPGSGAPPAETQQPPAEKEPQAGTENSP